MALPQGRDSFYPDFLGSVDAKPERQHGGKGRRYKDWEEDGWHWANAWSCGRRICPVCSAIERARRGEPLCGFTAKDGSRCLMIWGHAHPGDHAMCQPTTYDHHGPPAEVVQVLVGILGYDPFPPAPSVAWNTAWPMTWAVAGAPDPRPSAKKAELGVR